MTKFIPGGRARFQHQKRGLRRLIETRGVCALLMDPGTGKTATTMDYLSLLALKSPTPEIRVLVAAPEAATDAWVLQAGEWFSPQVGVWAEVLSGSILERCKALAARGGRPYKTSELPYKKEAPPKTGPYFKQAPRAKWIHRSAMLYTRSLTGEVNPNLGPSGENYGDTPRVVLCVLNLDTFKSRLQVGSKTMADIVHNAVTRFAPDVIVVDELHKLKGVSSNTSRLLGRIGRETPRRIGLTGTVMPHSPLDVFAQWRFLRPEVFPTFGAFKDRYAIMGGYMNRQAVSFHRLDDLQDKMAENSIVVRKQDALDLPSTTTAIVPVHLSPAEKRAYTEMKTQLISMLSAGQVTASNRLTQMMRLRQITSGFVRTDDGSLRTLGTSKANTIRSIVNDTLEGENRVVVFCHFSHEIAQLKDALAQEGTTVEVISGTVPKPERLAIRQRFGDTEKHPERIVLVAQFQTISLSVNELVTASHAVFGSLTQMRDDLIQSQDRLNRLGQTRPVTFWYAIAQGTVDAVTLKAHQDRTSLEDAMLQHIHETVAL